MTVSTTDSAQLREAAERVHARRWWILGLLALAQLMVVLDATIVNIALPSAQSDLDFSNGNRQWIVTAYALAFGSLLLLGGRLSDLYGRKRVFLVGAAGFALASALGGAATNFEILVTARALQGVFGALLAPASLALVSTTFEDPKERGKAFAVYSAIAGAGGGIGLLLGGVLTEYLDWRWCLFVNLFPAALALAGAAVLLVREIVGEGVRLDLPGAALSVSGLFAIVFGFSHAESSGWSDVGTLASLAAGVILLAAFVHVERTVAAPLVPMRLLVHRVRGGAYLATFFAGAGIFGVFLFLTYYMQGTLHYSPVTTGFAFLPLIVTASASSGLAMTRLLPRFGPRLIVTGGQLLGAVGLILMTQIGVTGSYASTILPGLIIVGLGLGMAFATGFDLGTRGVEAHDAGIASSLVNTTQQVGGSVATALLNTIAASALTGYLVDRGGGADALAHATVHSYVVAFWWSAGIFVVGAIISLFIFRGVTVASLADATGMTEEDEVADEQEDEQGAAVAVPLSAN